MYLKFCEHYQHCELAMNSADFQVLSEFVSQHFEVVLLKPLAKQ